MNHLTLNTSTADKEQNDKALKNLLEKCRHFLVGFTAVSG